MRVGHFLYNSFCKSKFWQCSLLAPLGQHRAQHIEPSKGGRAKKRKRSKPLEEPEAAKPPFPSIHHDIHVGLDSITRHFESAVGRNLPSSASTGEVVARHLAVVFLPKRREELVIAHLPVLAATASERCAVGTATRLVLLDVDAEKRLVGILGLPRVGAVGLLEGGEGNALIEYAREHVQPVDVPWMREAKSAEYLGSNIVVQETGPSVEVEKSSMIASKTQA